MIHAQNDSAFRESCTHGHLDIAQWLYTLGNINVHQQDDHNFHWSCAYGKLNVAKWLYSLENVDIHAYNDFAFRCNCVSGHLDVAKWLINICDDYEITDIISGTIMFKINKLLWFKNTKLFLFIF